MLSDETKKARIMEHAVKKFMSTGYMQVTMEEIARSVGMGKGTIYKFFPSKETLLGCAIDFFARRIELSIEKILSDEKMTDVDKLNAFLKTVAGKLSLLKPEVLASLERNAPEAFEKIEKTRQRIIMTNLVKLLEDGKKSGTYDPKMDTRLVAHVLIGAISHITDAKIISTFHYTADELFKMVTAIIFKGCLTDESRQLVFLQ